LFGVGDYSRRQITLRGSVECDVVVNGIVARGEHGQEESDRYSHQSGNERSGELDARG
jgi:hypothetical protein